MTEHFTRNTEGVTRWCNRCKRTTIHQVSDGRLGRCTEHEAPHETQKQKANRERRELQARCPTLF